MTGTSEAVRAAKGHAAIGVGRYDPVRSRTRGIGCWALGGSGIADPEDLAYYACFGTGDIAGDWCAWLAPGGLRRLEAKQGSWMK